MPQKYNPEEQEKKFWSRVDKSTHPLGCWIWLGCSVRGYGRVKWNQKIEQTHRISYLLAYDNLPSNLEVLHTCDNPSCVNPAHLFLGTQQDNADDMKSKKRQARGEKTGTSKLTVEDVRELYRLRSEEGMIFKDIGIILGISGSQAGRIYRGIGWEVARN